MNVFGKREQRKLACSAERRKGRMKSKKFFFCALVGAIGFAGAKTYEHSQKNISKDLLLQNVEALTFTPEEGVKIGTCYFDAWPDVTDEERKMAIKCATGTTMNTIYPCGSETRLVPQSTGSCIK